MSNCKCCSKEFVQVKLSHVYCGPVCAKKDWNRRNPELRNAQYKRKRARRWQPVEAYPTAVCAYCTGSFVPVTHNQIYCQRSCTTRGWYEKNPERARARYRRWRAKNPKKKAPHKAGPSSNANLAGVTF